MRRVRVIFKWRREWDSNPRSRYIFSNVITETHIAGRTLSKRVLSTTQASLQNGIPGRNRTDNLLLRRQLLYPLSYGYIVGNSIKKMDKIEAFYSSTSSSSTETMTPPLLLGNLLRKEGYFLGLNTTSLSFLA